MSSIFSTSISGFSESSRMQDLISSVKNNTSHINKLIDEYNSLPEKINRLEWEVNETTPPDTFIITDLGRKLIELVSE